MPLLETFQEMKKLISYGILAMLIVSCIPLRIAPHIKTDKVMMAKKFKRKLPKQNAFIFEDPKDANEFYHYINTKYELNHQNVEFNVPFEVNGKPFYFSFHEVEIPDKTLNIFPFFVDAVLHNQDMEPMFEDVYMSRTGNWYLVITVTDEGFNDVLAKDCPEKQDVVDYLKALRVEYLNTHNYLEALFKK